DQVRRAGQRLDGGDPAGDRQGDLRILRPERMLGPHLGRHRVRGLVAVRFGVCSGRGIHAEVRVVVDEARGDVFAGAVHHHRVAGRVGAPPPRAPPEEAHPATRAARATNAWLRMSTSLMTNAYFTSTNCSGVPTISVLTVRRGTSVET